MTVFRAFLVLDAYKHVRFSMTGVALEFTSELEDLIYAAGPRHQTCRAVQYMIATFRDPTTPSAD